MQSTLSRTWQGLRTLALFLALLSLMAGVKANPVDMTLAKQVGAKFINANTAMKVAPDRDLEWVTTYLTKNNDEAFHVFNMPKGFVIVSADDCATPILGYSEDGRFNTNDVPPQMEDYLQGFVEQIQYGVDNHLNADATIARQWEMVKATGRITEQRGAKAVQALLTNTWNQNCYYNNLCPEDPDGPCGHVYAGCTGTSMGQIMHYWKYPMSGTGSVTYTPSGYPEQSVDFGATVYDWDNMPDNLNASSSSTQINAVATLLWHCGVALNANYGPNGTGAYPSWVPNILTGYFNYSSDLYGADRSNYSDDMWLTMVKSSLDLGRPIHYSGWNSEGGDGHSFVCDGYDTNDYLHFNWGWSGNYNNYFALNALNAGSYNFSYYNFAVFNIHPDCIAGTTYQVSASANPSNCGAVSGSGTYDCGDFCTLTATANVGYMFLYWMDETGQTVSTQAEYSFTVMEDRALTAYFVEEGSVCGLTFNLNDSYGDGWNGNKLVFSCDNGYYEEITLESGTSGTQTLWIQNGSHVTLSWITGQYIGECSYTICYSNGNVVYYGSNMSSAFSYEFDVDCEEMPGVTFVIAAEASPTEGGSVSGASSYGYGTVCTLTAVPNEDYSFMYWTEYGNQVSSDTEYSFVVTSDRNLVAHFSLPFTVTVESDPVEGGTVNGTGSYDYGSVCTLIAVPNEDYSFLYWTENGNQVSSDAEYSFFVTSDHDMIAHFLKNCAMDPENVQAEVLSYTKAKVNWVSDNELFELRYKKGTPEGFENGIPDNWATIDADGDGYTWSIGDPVNNYHFDGYNSYQCVSSASYINYVGALNPDNYLVTPQMNLGGVIGFWACTQDVNYASEHFGVAVSTGSQNNPDDFTTVQEWQMTSKRSGTKSDIRGGNRAQGNWYYYTVDLSAYAGQTGYVAIRHFNCTDMYFLNVDDIDFGNSEWTTITGITSTSYTLTGLDRMNDFVVEVRSSCGDGSNYSNWVRTTFSNKHYTVTAEADPFEGGTVSGAGEYFSGSYCFLNAEANEGYSFLYWTEDGIEVSFEPGYSFIVNSDHDLVAHFSLPSMISAVASPEEGGRVFGAGYFDIGATCTLTAMNNYGYNFDSWTDAFGQVVSYQPVYSFTVTGDAEYQANFVEMENIFESVVMITNYDLQSNSSLGNRIATWADGSASIVATWDHSGSTSYPDRGTGYNYFDGSGFGEMPVARQEFIRSGWPSVAPCGEGEVFASHATGVNVYYRPVKGQGEWLQLANFSSIDLVWPRIATSGPVGQYIHVVASDEEYVNGTYVRHMYYIRSTDRGQTWSDVVEVPFVNNDADGDYRNQLSSDKYVMAANGDNVAILFGGYNTELFYVISHDNGATWEKQIVAPLPVEGLHAIVLEEDYPDGDDEIIYNCDGSHSIAIDDNGTVHVAFALFAWQPAGGSTYTLWKDLNHGIVYWNSGYVNEEGGHEILGSLELGNLNLLADADGHKHLHVTGHEVDEDGDGVWNASDNNRPWGNRTKGHSTTPGISVDDQGDVAIVFSTLSEVRTNYNGYHNRSAFVTLKDHVGNWFDNAVNLSEGLNHVDDDVYPTFAATNSYNGTFWLGYSADDVQGLYMDDSNDGMLTENRIYAVNLDPSNLPGWGQAHQTIALSAGTNWVSFNVETDLDDLKAALVDALSGTGTIAITIQGKSQNTKYTGGRWRGTLNFEVTQMYMIDVSADCEITLEGAPVNSNEHPITIVNGANWIAYPLDVSMTQDQAFAGFNVVNGDVISAKGGNARYTGGRWRGTVTLTPGQGYIYTSAASGNRVLTFPGGAKTQR